MDKAIEVFAPILPTTKEWSTLAQKDRDWILEHTSNAITNFRQSGLKAIQCCAEVAMIQNFLEGKPLTFTTWMKSVFPDEASERTGWRWLKNYKELRGSASDSAILYLAESGISGMNNLGQREILTAVKRLPPPKGSDKKQLESWKNKVGETVRELRRSRRSGKPRKLDEEEALKVFILTGRRLLRECGLKTSAEQRAWLKRGTGMIMELRAIPGTVTTERIPVPDGFLPQVGRPRKSPKTHQ